MSYKPSEEELAALDKVSRAMEPEAWAEYDAGQGRCSNMAGWACLRSIECGKRLIRAFPGIVSVVNTKD